MTAIEKAILRMPVAFGPNPSPRQGRAPVTQFDQVNSPRKRSLYARFETNADAVSCLIPKNCVLRGAPQIAFEFTVLEDLHWLAGRGYNMLSVRIPVEWKGTEKIDGWAQPVVWENLTEPILSGREELGWSKIYADLPMPTEQDGGIRVGAEWMGFEFFEMRLEALEGTAVPPQVGGNLIHQKVMPSTGAWGELDVDYCTLTPAGNSSARLTSHSQGSASARFNSPTWQQMPTQFHIVSALAEIPLIRLVTAGIYESIGGKDLSDQRRLDLS